MPRRMIALLGIVVIAGLVLMLMWRVYLHRNNNLESDEPAVVRLQISDRLPSSFSPD